MTDTYSNRKRFARAVSALLAAIFLALPGSACELEKVADEPKEIVMNAAGLPTWDGALVEPFIPGPNHQKGILHSKMYRVKHADGWTLIKVMGGRHANDYGNSREGALLAQEVGGAKVRGFGKLRDVDKTVARYLEFAELFPNEPTSTYKGLRKRMATPSVFLGGTPRLTKRIAQLFARTYAAHLLPNYDVDFIFSKDDAAWIDTMAWNRLPEIKADRLMALSLTVQDLKDEGPDVIQAFREDWREAVTTQPGLSPKERAVLLKALGLE